MRIEEKLDVSLYGFAQIASYHVACFNRMLYVIFNPIPPMQMFGKNEFEKELEKLYFKWHENDNEDFCCEEFMLGHLPQEMYDSIIAVMYDIDEED